MMATQALGWALVHSLWQCALAAAGLAWLLSILPSGAARMRYALATATLVLMVAMPLGTALSLHEASPWYGAPAAVLTRAQILAGPAGAGVGRPAPGPAGRPGGGARGGARVDGVLLRPAAGGVGWGGGGGRRRGGGAAPPPPRAGEMAGGGWAGRRHVPRRRGV